MESIVLEQMILPFHDQVYYLVIFTLSFCVGGWLITDHLSLSLHLFILRFKLASDL